MLAAALNPEWWTTLARYPRKPPGASGPTARTFGRLRESGSAHQEKGGSDAHFSQTMLQFCEKGGCRSGGRNGAARMLCSRASQSWESRLISR